MRPRDFPSEPGNPGPASAGPAFRSLVFEDIPVPDYADVMVLAVPDGAPSDPRRWAETVFSRDAMPGWVRFLLSVRQSVVGILGIPKAAPGVFDVAEVRGEEALIIADDVHLDFRCGVAYDAGARLLRLATAVRLKGWRGRLYFAPVRLVHPVIVHAMMKRAARVLTDARQ